MLSTSRIMSVIAQDKFSRRKRKARKGQRYYDGMHDILEYRVFFINKENKLEEDLTRSNIRIPHPFFQEIADQEVAYVLSGNVEFDSEYQELKEALKPYFNDDFTGELQEILTDTIVRGFGYVYWYRDENNRTRFVHADSLGVAEVKDGDGTDTVNDYIIRYYPVYVKDGKTATRVEVWDGNMTYYYIQNGASLELDKNVKLNPCPHVLYQVGSEYYYEECNRLPFLRLDNNRYQQSVLQKIKPIIDDYDLMSCGLSNNLQDVAEGIYVVKGFKGSSIDELVQNVKAKKAIGVSEKGDLDIKTINIPYEARKQKMEMDEKNIYRFALAFNAAQTGDGNITNIVIISRYTLLDMKSKKLIIRLKKFLRKLLEVVLQEINQNQGTSYTLEDVDIKIKPVIPTNERENAEIEKSRAETRRIEVDTVLDIADVIDRESLLEEVCRVMELDYDEVKAAVLSQEEIESLKEALDESIPEAGTEEAP